MVIIVNRQKFLRILVSVLVLSVLGFSVGIAWHHQERRFEPNRQNERIIKKWFPSPSPIFSPSLNSQLSQKKESQL